jgi:hypothetical protein
MRSSTNSLVHSWNLLPCVKVSHHHSSCPFIRRTSGFNGSRLTPGTSTLFANLSISSLGFTSVLILCFSSSSFSIHFSSTVPSNTFSKVSAMVEML